MRTELRSVLPVVVLLAGGAIILGVGVGVLNRADVVKQPPDVIEWPVTVDLTKGRMNLGLILGEWPGPDPASTWLWRRREGKVERVQQVELPTGTQLLNVPLRPELFQQGDVVLIQWHPRVLVSAEVYGRVEVPFASVIDGVTSDPITMPGTRVREGMLNR